MRSPVLSLMLLSCLAMVWPAAAQDSAGDRRIESVPVNTGEDSAPPEEQVSSTYSTIGLSKVGTDFRNVKDAVNLDSTLIGLRIPTFPWIGVELNASFTVIPGQIDQPNCGFPGPACPSNVSAGRDSFVAHMFGVYGVVRTPGTFFGTAKYGYRSLNSNLPELEDERSGTAWALGGGYRWSREGFAEISYSKLADNVDSIALTFSYSRDR